MCIRDSRFPSPSWPDSAALERRFSPCVAERSLTFILFPSHPIAVQGRIPMAHIAVPPGALAHAWTCAAQEPFGRHSERNAERGEELRRWRGNAEQVTPNGFRNRVGQSGYLCRRHTSGRALKALCQLSPVQEGIDLHVPLRHVWPRLIGWQWASLNTLHGPSGSAIRLPVGAVPQLRHPCRVAKRQCAVGWGPSGHSWSTYRRVEV